MRPIKRANMNLFEHDPEEVIIGEAIRHGIGIVLIVLSSLFVILVINFFTYFMIDNEDTFTSNVGIENSLNLSGLLGIAMSIVSTLVVIGTAMAIYVYNRNYIVLTDQKIVLVTTFSIIGRKVSQLSIGDVQDISVQQSSLLSRIFKFGTVFVETSGEQANIQMTYTKHPFEVSKAIVDSHESNMKKYGN